MAFNRVKRLAGLIIVLFGMWSPGFAAAEEQRETAEYYFNELRQADSLASYKEQRDQSTNQILEDLSKTYPILSKDKSDLGKAVVDRKVKIMREREFLTTEFGRGLNALYEKAVEKYSKQLFAASQKDFLEVEKLFPDYKETRIYLKKLEKLLSPG